MKTEYRPYRAKTMLNTLKRPDHWFWIKYTLNPYRGCAHLCVYCDARDNQYGLSETFDEVVYCKENAVEVLEKQLPRLARDVVGTGGVCDAYQPVEEGRRITRRVLESLARYAFPVEVLTKSDLVVRDLDILQEIDERAWAGVLFTITSLDPQITGFFEPHAPPPERRLKAMERVGRAGLTTGVMLCPWLPGISDDEEHIEEVVRRTKEAGGEFVLHGGLTLKAGPQRDRYMAALTSRWPHLVSWYEDLYSGGYSPGGAYARQVSLLAREVCQRYDMPDRMPRPVVQGHRLANNKRLAARLADEVYEMELAGEKGYRIWARRKAAWALEDPEYDVREIYERMGRRGLEGIPNIGNSLARRLETWLESENPEGSEIGSCE